MHTFYFPLRCSVFLLLLVASLAGCTTSRIPKPASQLGPGVYQGTGFLVRSDGLVLTAYHVVEEGNTIKVRCQDYDLVSAKLGERSRTMDLAVLYTGLTGTPYLPPAAPRSARPGDQVFSMGSPPRATWARSPSTPAGRSAR
jgi:S1-C subfamily serine protease